MKTLLLLTGSLVLAVVLCLILLVTGVLKFGDNGVVAKVQPVGEKVISRVTKAPDAIPNALEDPSLPVREKILATSPKSDRTSPPMVDFKTPRPVNIPVSTGRSDVVHKKAHEFLRTNAGRADIENRFADYLMVDLGVDQGEAARLVRMSFWKNCDLCSWVVRDKSGRQFKLDVSFLEPLSILIV